MENLNIESDGQGKYVEVEAHSTQENLPSGLVLLVDDEKDICECLGHILNATGHTEITFTNPIEALEYYTKHYIKVALVILDMVMPKMNGSDVFLAMKFINPAIQAVMISGLCSEEVVAECLAKGAAEFVHKPFSASRIIGVVDKYVLSSPADLR